MDRLLTKFPDHMDNGLRFFRKSRFTFSGRNDQGTVYVLGTGIWIHIQYILHNAGISSIAADEGFSEIKMA